LAIIRELMPQIAELVESHPDDDAEVDAETNRRGIPTLRLGGRSVHSSHDPEREAGRLIAGVRDTEPRAIVFEGFGLGYHVEHAIESGGSENLIVVEPSVTVFRAALASRSLEGVLRCRRLSLLLAADPSAISGVLSGFDPNRVALLRLRAVYERYSDYFSTLEDQVRALTHRRNVNFNTLNRFGRLWVRNLARNTRVLLNASDVGETAGLFRGESALLVAAGPTFDSVAPRLASLARRMVVVAVDTAYPLCLSLGIVPDFVVIVDPQYWNTRHLDGVDRKLAELGAEPPVVVAESSTHPRVFRLLASSPILLSSSLFPLGRYVETGLGESRRSLGAGGSVSTSGFDFCRLLGVSEIYCAGLDLGFPRMQTHARGSFFEERLLCIADRTQPIDTAIIGYIRGGNPFVAESAGGGSVTTDQRMVVYKWWFEHQLSNPPTDEREPSRLVLLSGEGLAIAGATLADGGFSATKIQQSDERRLKMQDLRGRLLEKRGQDRSSDKSRKLRAAYEGLSEQLQQIHDIAATALKTSEKAGQRPEALEELEAHDRELLQTSAREIVSFLLQREIREIEGARAPENLEVALERSRMLYAGLQSSADYHIRELATAIERLGD
jgi:hypothetical protein